MFVVYASYEIGAWSREDFDAFFLPLVEEARACQGCVLFDYLIDPATPTRTAVIEVWQEAADFERWSRSAAHDRMVSLPTLTDGGMGDLHVHLWRDARGHHTHGVADRG
jgi:quinol monooxygenase YgiN